jgi:hypothetical protein
MRPTEKKIENLIQNLTNQTRPELDARILNDCLKELNTQTSSAPVLKANIWSTIMHSKMTKSIAAAIMMVGGFLCLTVLNNTVPVIYALEETVQAMQDIRTIHLFGKDWDNDEFEMWIQLNPETGIPEYIYADYFTKGILDISRPDKSYQYNKRANRLLINSGRLYNINVAPAKIVEQFTRAVKNPLAHARVTMYHETDAETGKAVMVIDFEMEKEARKIYIDPETKLPIRIIGLKNGYIGAIFKDIDRMEYNVDLPEGIFDFEIPEDADVTDMDQVMRQLNDPQFGMPCQNLTEEEAAVQIATDFWKAVISQDRPTLLQLAPCGTMSSCTSITEIVNIGNPYIQNGCGIGKVVPSRLRFNDGTLREIKIIVRFRDQNQSCVIAGTYGGTVTIPE